MLLHFQWKKNPLMYELENWLCNLALFDPPPPITPTQNSMISFCYLPLMFSKKTFLTLYPFLENSTTGIAIIVEEDSMTYMRKRRALEDNKVPPS